MLAAGTNYLTEAISITHPHAGAQAALTRTLLQATGVDPSDASIIEMHDTETQAGHWTEIELGLDVFGECQRSREKELYLQSSLMWVTEGPQLALLC